MWQSRLETQRYIARLVLKMAHKVFGSILLRVVILYGRPLAVYCPVDGMSFGLCPMMMSHFGTKKGWLKDAIFGENSSSLLFDFGSLEHVPDDKEGSTLSLSPSFYF